MYFYDIHRWWRGPEGKLIAETITWQQHFQIIETTDADGNPVSTNEPLDPRARALGPLCPPEVPPEDDIWLFRVGVGLDWMDFETMGFTPNGPIEPSFTSVYWSVYAAPVLTGWEPITQEVYVNEKALADAALQATYDDGVADGLVAGQAAWDAKSATLAADGLGAAAIEALIGPRPVPPGV